MSSTGIGVAVSVLRIVGDKRLRHGPQALAESFGQAGITKSLVKIIQLFSVAVM